MKLEELKSIAQSKNVSGKKKAELIDGILATIEKVVEQANEVNSAQKKEKPQEEPATETELKSGVLDIHPDGYGFLRAENCEYGIKDAYVSAKMIKSLGLRSGDFIKGVAKKNPEGSTKPSGIISVDSVNGEKLANPGFIVKLVPFSASKQNEDLDEALRVANCETMMNLSMTRSIDSEIDEDDLTYDNIAEIVKFENTVGKRDIETIAGNADPKQGEFAISLVERDASATELITFTPPTGLNTNTALTIQMLIVSVVALVILAVGIIVIKKTVLKK